MAVDDEHNNRAKGQDTRSGGLRTARRFFEKLAGS